MAESTEQTTSGRSELESRNRLRDKRFLAIAAAIAAALFCGLVLGVLVTVRLQEGPAAPDLTAYESLREDLEAGAGDERLTELVRQVDARLRAEYIANRRRTAIGAALLLAGAAAFVASLRWYVHVDRPQPVPGDLSERNNPDTWLRRRRVRLIGFGAGVALVIVVVGLIALTGPADYPRDETALASQPTDGAPRPVESQEQPEPAFADNWPRFRGPTGMGVVPEGDWPETWNAADGVNVLWKTPIPSPGKSSPVLWGNRVFLTGASEESREVMCFNRTTGELLWRTPIPTRGAPDAEVSVFDETGYAAPTPVADGERVYAFFATADLAAVDFGGELAWVRNLGDPTNAYGIATSPILEGGKLILQFDRGFSADDGLSALIALDPASGNPIWRKGRPVANSWSTPVVVDGEKGRIILTCASPWVTAYDAETGDEFWRAELLSGDVAPSPVFDGENIHVTNEYAVSAAVKSGGSGDVTDTNVLWKNDQLALSDAPSPICNGELFLQVTSYGVISCQDTATGDLIWEHELDGTVWASPSLVGDRIYLTALDGTTHIFPLAREYSEMSSGSVGEEVYGSAAFGDSKIYIRGSEHLFCISADVEG